MVGVRQKCCKVCGRSAANLAKSAVNFQNSAAESENSAAEKSQTAAQYGWISEVPEKSAAAVWQSLGEMGHCQCVRHGWGAQKRGCFPYVAQESASFAWCLSESYGLSAIPQVYFTQICCERTMFPHCIRTTYTPGAKPSSESDAGAVAAYRTRRPSDE